MKHIKGQHTKGEWNVAYGGDRIDIVSKDKGNNNRYSIISAIEFTTEEAEANAKLIAGAPALLEALIGVTRELASYTDLNEFAYPDEVSNAYKAIKKATE